MDNQVAAAGDVRFMAVLLKEHPLKSLSSLEAIAGHQRGSLREIRNDRVGLEQRPPIVELDRRNSSVWKFAKKVLLASLANDDVLVDPLERHPKLGQQQPDLISVA